MAITNANGIEILYTESGDGEPLLLLHGGQSDRHQFDVFRPLLGEGVRAIAYDQRDSPEAPYTGGDYSMHDHAADCAAFIKVIGLNKAHLMGTSYGGMVALVTAIEYPECVQSLILSGTTPSFAMAEPVAGPATAEHDPAAIERFMMEMAITPDAIDNDPDLVADYRAALRLREPDALDRRMAAARASDSRDRLGDVKAPTLILHGDQDPLISPKTAEWMAVRIPKAKLVLLPGSRHGLTLQHRQRTADHVRSFVLSNTLGKDS